MARDHAWEETSYFCGLEVTLISLIKKVTAAPEVRSLCNTSRSATFTTYRVISRTNHGKKRTDFAPGVHLIMLAQKPPQQHRIHFKRYAYIQKYRINRLFRYYGNYFTQTLVVKYFSDSTVSSEDLVTELLRLAIDDETFLSPDTESTALSTSKETQAVKATSVVPIEKFNEYFSTTASLG